MSRYRDAPFEALRSRFAFFYIALNALASFLALGAIIEFHWLMELTLLMKSIIAGVSAMALLRSSLFTFRVGNADIGIGPAAFLQIMLNVADRECDRRQAQPRADAVKRIMSGISFTKAKQALPSFCFGLLQNVGEQEQSNFGTIVARIEKADMDDVFKSNSLGLALMNVVGIKVLDRAVDMIRHDISTPPRRIVQSPSVLVHLRNVGSYASARQLIEMCLLMSDKMEDSLLREQIDRADKTIEATTFSERQKALMLCAWLIGKFGEDGVLVALKALPENLALAQS